MAEASAWIDWDDLYSVLTQADRTDDFVVAEISAEASEEGDRAKCRPFCVVELRPKSTCRIARRCWLTG